jgi:hypothetical protein
VDAGPLAVTKFLASVSYFVALLLISLPLISISFILGGVSPASIAVSYAVALSVTVLVGSIGLYYSCRFERSFASIPAASVTVIGGGLIFLAISGESAPLSHLSHGILFHLFPFEGPGGQTAVPFPGWLGPVLLGLTGGAYFLRASVIRLRFEPERRYALLRFIGYVFLVLFLALTVAHVVFGRDATRGPRAAASILGYILAWLLFAAPWLGANHTVSRSGRRGAGSPGPARRLAGLLQSLLLRGRQYVALLLGTAAAVIEIAVRLGSDKPGDPVLRWLCLGVVVFAGLTWTRLGEWLSDRPTARGRRIGMGAAYLIAWALFLAPVILRHATMNRDTGVPPAPVQFVTLLSPGTAVERLETVALRFMRMPALERLPGGLEPMWLPLAFYAGTFLLLTLAVCVSSARARRREQESGPTSRHPPGT